MTFARLFSFAAAVALAVSAAFADKPARPPAPPVPPILRTNIQFADKYFPPILASIPDLARSQTIVIGAETFLGRRAPVPGDAPSCGLYAVDDITGAIKPWRPSLFHESQCANI